MSYSFYVWMLSSNIIIKQSERDIAAGEKIAWKQMTINSQGKFQENPRVYAPHPILQLQEERARGFAIVVSLL